MFVATAVTARDIAAARRFLAAEHPQADSRHGMFVCLYRVRDDESQRLICVAQLGEYFHTHYPGRAVFGRPMLGPGYARMGRGEVIKAIPIVAAKRFAIRNRQQGRGWGDVLAAETLIVARSYRWPPARVVEVSRHMGARKFFAACCGTARDFLTRSGYVPVPLGDWLCKGVLDRRVADGLTDRNVPGYYYADLSSADPPSAIARARKADG